MNPIYNALRDQWIRAGVPVNDGADIKDIAHLENAHQFVLPRSLVDYLRTVNGMSGGSTDENVVSFLPVDIIEDETIKNREHIDIIFAEYLIYSHCYALRCTGTGHECGVYVVDGTNERRLADTFDGFLELYLTNPQAVAYGWQ